jgi:2-polyprenyl-6-methoxyphenol hydroxylase-like FAD-dependent oxidoreductase
MNVGMREAEELFGRMVKILKEKAPLDLLEAYNRTRREEWEKLLGIGPGLRTESGAASWVKERYKRILPCLPASGEDLALLVSQLGLQFQ